MNALHLSASAEWGTPAWIVAYARSVLGTIDLDPASSADWNASVKADRFLTAEEDGLTTSWGDAKNVFLNPPGDRSGKLVRAFHAKAQAHVNANPGARVLWVGFSMEQLVFFCGSSIMILPKRVRYIRPDGTEGSCPTHGSFLGLIGQGELTPIEGSAIYYAK
jgi:phage N-6-adenine-methyltransferase